ncbi:MAG: hypothetical protein Q27BPR15_03215 [Rhodobacter sp. CACIA14H1]|nr:MAG: hypothetical protein Q27BPR15_03215 [Rhodobacter sp. CACIA14H1]
MKKLAALLALSGAPALAHPGHVAAAVEGDSHWLTQADHLAVVVGVFVLAGLLAWPRGRAALARLLG